ncbi:MAG: hypothetical protein M0P64_01790 [Candidatus Pacebacteria bacterium]|nr:hypothetical protein [Candidatus Paceibacterota bacterium]
MKKIVLLTALGAFVYSFVSSYPVAFGLCKNIAVWSSGTEYCRDGSIFSESLGQLVGFLSLSLLFLSLVTYWMKEQVFRAWWNFARKWVVIIIATTFFFEYMGGGGGYLGMGQDFLFLVLGIFYTIMIVGSILKIEKTYLKTK